jgi:hypothetical protein
MFLIPASRNCFMLVKNQLTDLDCCKPSSLPGIPGGDVESCRRVTEGFEAELTCIHFVHHVLLSK